MLKTPEDRAIWAAFAIGAMVAPCNQEPERRLMNSICDIADTLFNAMLDRCSEPEATYGLGGKGD